MQVDFFIKIAFLAVFLLYIIFTFVVFTQVRAMTKIAKISSSPFLTTLSLLHILFAISLFIVSLVIL